tara:strand:- start:332 stop:946 length:615 start_codon:yes stop_codon:yes gene_type:complete
MADKPQARGMPIPSGMTVQPEGSSEDSVAMQPEIQDKMVDPTKDEEVQIDQVLGNLMDFIWDDGYEAIVEKLNQSPPDELSQSIGKTAGRMLAREIDSAKSGGVNVSQDVLLSIGSELVNNIAEVAKNEGLIKNMSEKEEQQLQGEALIFATEQFVDDSPEGIDPSGPMKMAASALRGTYDGETEMPRMGVPADIGSISLQEGS